jgi:hypothetical protein
MKFGTKVLVERGGGAPAGTPGCKRLVRGVLIGASGKHTRIVRLLEDDPFSTVPEWSRKGAVGRWSPSAVIAQDDVGGARWRVPGFKVDPR